MAIPDRCTFIQLAQTSTFVPVYEHLTADTETPISLYAKLVGDQPGFLLESVEGGEQLGRYSFIGLDPFLSMTVSGSTCSITDHDGTITQTGNPFQILRNQIQRCTPAQVDGLPRFYGGAVGYFGFEMAENLERLETPLHDDLQLPDACLLFPRVVLALDHVKSRLQIIVNVQINGDAESHYNDALAMIDQVKERLHCPLPKQVQSTAANQSVSSNVSREQFIEMVKQGQEYIMAGDIFQVVLSQRLSAPLNVQPFTLYRTLRSINPSPYLYYLNFGSIKLVGSSPEMLVRVENGTVCTRPIAGTRPRGLNEIEDNHLAQDLLQDEKECAEHSMLVDLGRNDIGKVSSYGSVTMPTIMAVERYSHVMHIVSEVQGRLADGLDALDALQSCFPAGTVSGAPKVRAMQIIRELEGVKRGPYAGAVGYLGFDGNMDTCITIRTFVIADNQVYVQAGAGIVADSVPETEYRETLNKARALLQALKLSGEGLQ